MRSDEADVVIVGSGPAGAAYARTIADSWPEARIVMVESGPLIGKRPGEHVFNIRDAASRREAELASQGPRRALPYDPITEADWALRIAGSPDAAMLRRPGLFAVGSGGPDGDGFPAGHGASNVGGMGSHWFGGCPRPALSERVPFIPAMVMDEALDAATAMLRSAADQYPDSPIAPVIEERVGALFNAGRPVDRRVQPMPMALVRTPEGMVKTGPGIMLGDLLGAGSERFDLRAETIARRVLHADGRAHGVEVADARTGVVTQLRAGAVVVAADALHGPQLLHASGIRPAALGHYLNEHLQVGAMVALEGVEPGPGETGVTWVPYLDESFPFSITITQAEPPMLPFGPPGGDRGMRTIFVSLFSASDLLWDNRVAFSETELDWRGLPRLEPHYRPSANDLERLEAAKGVVRRIADVLGHQLPGTTFMRPPYGSSLHYQGTTRMGAANDGESVCDRDSRVWGLSNVFVAGNGVIPTVTGTNPTLTMVALAILGGRALAEDARRAPVGLS